MPTAVMRLAGVSLRNPELTLPGRPSLVQPGTVLLYDAADPVSFPAQGQPSVGTQVLNLANLAQAPGTFEGGGASAVSYQGGGWEFLNTSNASPALIRGPVLTPSAWTHPVIIAWVGLRAGAALQGVAGQSEGYGNAANDGWVLDCGEDGVTPRLWLYAQDGSGGNWQPSFGSRPGLHMLAADLDYPTNTITLYVDNEVVGTTTFPAGFGGLRNSGRMFGIGNWSGDGVSQNQLRNKVYSVSIEDVTATGGGRTAAQAIADSWAMNSSRYS